MSFAYDETTHYSHRRERPGHSFCTSRMDFDIIMGRTDKLGRPAWYLTREFLNVAGYLSMNIGFGPFLALFDIRQLKMCLSISL